MRFKVIQLIVGKPNRADKSLGIDDDEYKGPSRTPFKYIVKPARTLKKRKNVKTLRGHTVGY